MKIISHRGAKGLAPEHTVASFEAALANNADEIECDIRVSKDGIPVLEHDNTIEAADGKNYEVSSFTLHELQSYKPDLMTLAQAIELINKRCVLQIEVKPSEQTDAVISVVEGFVSKGWNYDLFVVSSRSFEALKAVHQRNPDMPLAVIEIWSSIRATSRAHKLGTKRISLNEHVMWGGFIKHMSQRGWQLCGYAMNDLPRARRWKRYGLYAIITDYPDRFKEL